MRTERYSANCISHFLHRTLGAPLERPLILAFFLAVGSFSFASVFTVTNLNNTGNGSFYQALLNAQNHPGPDEVHFNIPAGAADNSGFFNVHFSPNFTSNQELKIDGTTQPGFNGDPIVKLNMSGNFIRNSNSSIEIDGLIFESSQSGSYYIYDYYGQNLKVNNCKFSNNGNSFRTYAILSIRNNSLVVTNCEFENKRLGIYAYNYNYNENYYLRIENNHFSSTNNQHAILINGNSNNSIQFDFAIRNNYFVNANYSILTRFIKGISIENNQFEQCDRPVYVYVCPEVELKNNYDFPTNSGTSLTGNYGYFIYNCSDSKISNNSVCNKNFGFYSYYSHNSIFKDNNINTANYGYYLIGDNNSNINGTKIRHVQTFASGQASNSTVYNTSVVSQATWCNGFTFPAPPTLSCQNATISSGTVDPNDFITGQSAPGGGTTVSVSPSSFDCNQSGNQNVTITITDQYGQSASCTAVANVVNSGPKIYGNDLSLTLDANGTATIPTVTTPASTIFSEDWSGVGNGYYNNTTIPNWTVNGDIDVSDYVAAMPGKEIDLAGFTNSSMETQNTFSLVPGEYGFKISHTTNGNSSSNNAVQVEIGDLFNETFASSTAIQHEQVNFKVFDTTDVSIVMTQLGANDAGGSFIGSVALEKLGSSYPAIISFVGDACESSSYSISQNSFDCNDTGNNTVTINAVDASGNTSSLDVIVEVIDNSIPNLVVQDITVALDVNGQASITGQDLDNGSTDNCNLTWSLSQDQFDCDDLDAGTSAQSTLALDFDGQNDYLITNSNIVHQSNFTYEAWVNIDAANDWDGIFTTYTPGTNDNLVQFNLNSAGRIRFEIKGANGDNTRKIWDGTTNLIGSWHHIAATYDGTTIALYVDGQPEPISNMIDNDVVGPLNINKRYLMGSERNFGPRFDGRIDEIRMWNITKSASQIASEMLITLTGNEPGLIAYWPIEEGSGNLTTDLVSGNNFAMSNMDPNSDWVQGNLNIQAQNGVEVTLTATDESGNTGTADAIVTVVDNIPPSINCPPNRNAYATNANGAVVNYNAPFASDNCGVESLNLTAGLASGSTFPIGTTTVTYEAVDASGNTASCSFTVTVEGIPPSILCPADMSTSNDPGTCGAVVFFNASESQGIPAANITYSHAPGSTFPVGSTIVTATATNAVGSSSCTFMVTVNDNEAPVISCPSNITVDADAGQCDAIVNYAATAQDNCGSATVSYDIAPGSFFAVGTTTVTATATDAAGNSASCSFTITVNDTEMPQLQGVPSDVTVQCDQVPAPANVTAADNCSGANVVMNEIISTASVPTNGLLGYWTMNEGIGSSVSDQSGNGITGTKSTDANWTAGQSGSGIAFNGINKGWVEFPNSSGGALDARYSVSMFASFFPGNNGNTSTPIIQFNPNSWGCHLWQTGANQLFVRFTTRTGAFTSALASNTLIQGQWNCVGATYDYNTGIAKLYCNGALVAQQNIGIIELSTQHAVRVGQVNFDGRRTNGKVDNVAIYDRALSLQEVQSMCDEPCPQAKVITRIWTATDAIGNTTSASQEIQVIDNVAPVVTVPSDISVSNDQGQCGAVVTYNVQASDNCSNNLTYTYSHASGSSFPLGSTTVQVTVEDECGNETVESFNVTVNDVEAPVVTCPGTITLHNNADQCGANASYAAVVTDNCPGVTVSYSHPSGSFFDVGTTTVTAIATDANGNSSSCMFNVVVNDIQAPEFQALVGNPFPANSASQPGVFAKQPGALHGGSPYYHNMVDHADFDLDGDMDLVYALNGNSPSVFLNDGLGGMTGGFQHGGNIANAVTTADLNGDGASDLIYAIWGGPNNMQSRVFLNDGTGSFTLSQANIGGEDRVNDVKAGDLDGDGDLDLYFVGSGYNNRTDRVWFNNGSGVFTPSSQVFNNGKWGTQVALADFDSDGDLDAFVAADYPNNNSSLWLNNGSGVFAVAQSGLPNGYHPRAVDYDNDGDLDVAYGQGGSTGNINIYLNDGSGNLTASTDAYASSPGSYGTSSVEFGDLDNDGDDDMVIGYTGNSNANSPRIYLNNGTGNYVPGNNISLEYVWGVRNMLLIDMDNDGDKDFVNANYGYFNEVVFNQYTHPSQGGCEDINAVADAGSCGTAVNYDYAAVDNCPNVNTVYSHTPGSVFTVGSTTVTATATDASGNVSTCSFDVVVTDEEAPTIACPADITVFATSANGAVVNYSTPSTADNCPGETLAMTAGLASGSTFPLGVTTVSFEVTDASGNKANCSFTVDVQGVAPQIACPTQVTSNNDLGNCSAVVSFQATDNVGIPASTITYSHAPGSVFPVGTTMVTATATNPVGSSSCTFPVIVTDTEAPNAVCQNVTIQLDAAGAASITATDIDGGSTDNCGVASIAASQTSFDCSHVGSNTVTLTVTDVNGNMSTCDATVTVEDNVAPTAVCQDVTIQLDASGNASIAGPSSSQTIYAEDFTSNAFAGNSTSLYGWNVLYGNIDIGNWNGTSIPGNEIDLGGNQNSKVETANTIALSPGNYALSFDYITNSNPNPNNSMRVTLGSLVDQTYPAPSSVQSESINFTVNSTVSAKLTLEELGVNDNSGTFIGNIQLVKMIPGSLLIENGSSDACGIASISASQTDFDCSHAGGNTVTLTVTDVNGNVSTCDATVTVEDNIAPTAVCQDVTIQLDANGAASIVAADIDGGSSDNCGIASIAASQTSFDCSHVGSNTVTLTVTDVNGNISTCDATVTVQDNIAPTAVCQDITIQLDANGAASIVAADIDGGSTDNCGVASISASQTSFDCNHVGSNTVTLTVTDVNGNVSTCNAAVTVQDNIAPTAVCQDVTIQLDANGAASIVAADIDGGSFDNCGVASISASQTSFDCSHVGSNTVTLTVTDVNGNVSTCDATVTVQDNIAPTAVCQDVTIQLDAAGAASIAATDIDGGSFDNCGIASIAASQTSFDCSHVGSNTVTLTVTDVNGNVSTCDATVTVQDNIAPTAVCQDVTIQLDANGAASITAADIDGGSFDNCGIASISASQTSFDCSHVGSNTVTLTVTDVNGNVSTCNAAVTVQDNIAPTAVCQDVTIQLDAAGAASIAASDIDGGSFDNCGVASISASQTSFDCSHVGSNTVILTVTDVNGNVSTCVATVTVQDNIAPTAVCQDVTIQLDANGAASITAADIDGGSFDNCGIASIAASQTSFECSHVGSNTVTLTVTDVNGNVSTCDATVTVQDNIAPTAICQDVTIQLDAAGVASILAADIDGGSFDNCAVASIAASQTSFDCSHVGGNTVTLTVTDVNGNVSTCDATVTVEDDIAPSITCPADITVNNDPNVCEAVVMYEATASDNCEATVTYTHDPGSTFLVGTTTVTATATDPSGNSTSCSFDVVVEDNEAPEVLTQNISVTLSNGTVSITPADIDAGTNDNCGVDALSIDLDTWGCGDIGDHTVILSATDIHGNVANASAVVSVIGAVPYCSIASSPTSSVNTGGDPNTLYLGYGAQSTVLQTTVGGGSNFSYSWTGTGLDCYNCANPTFTPTQEGSYTFNVDIVNEFGCETSCTITVCVYDVRVYNKKGKLQKNKVLVCHAPPGNPGNAHTISVGANAVQAHLAHGCSIGDCNKGECSSLPAKMAGNADDDHDHAEEHSVVEMESELVVFPNPAQERFTVRWNSENDNEISIRILDLSGKIIQEKSARPNVDIPMTWNVAKGVYLVEVTQDGEKMMLRLVKH